MAILEVDAKMLEQMTSKGKTTQKSKPTKAVAKRKKPEVVTPPESGEDTNPDGEICGTETAAPPQKKVKGPKPPKAVKVPKESQKGEAPAKKPLTEKQQAALEKRKAAAAALTDEEKAERKRLMLEKRKATQAAKAAKAAEELVEESEPAPKKVKKVKTEEKPPKWLKDYVSTAKELEEDPETVEERAAESWKTQKKKLVNKYMRNNASLYSMIFRR
jgi:hypothetical protein